MQVKPKRWSHGGETGIPIFEPSMEEFKDFYSFIKSVQHYGFAAGLIKVKPPQEWIDQNNTSFEILRDLRVARPITQQFNCGGLPAGSHRQLNIELRKTYSVDEWFEISESEKYRPPVFSDSGKMFLASQTKKRNPKVLNGLIENTSDKNLDKQIGLDKTNNVVKDSKKVSGEISTPNTLQEKTIEAKNTPFTDTMQVPSYVNVAPERLTVDYLTALERFYWRNLSFNPTMYGADLTGSLFTPNPNNSWDVSMLESLLSRVNVQIPGVTSPYLYFGLYKATFAWHVEDMDLFSINYIHFGNPKQWYAVPAAHRSRFENLASSLFYDEAGKCSEFLRFRSTIKARHKNCVISPSVLNNHNIPVNKLVQYANEFVITFPGAYHQGYNTGFNCAESINFATESWIDFGIAAKSCRCITDSVSLDVEGIFGSGKSSHKPLVKPRILKDISYKLPKKKCVFCPLGHTEKFPLLPTDIPNKFCHLECGSYIPETWIDLGIDSLNNTNNNEENVYPSDAIAVEVENNLENVVNDGETGLNQSLGLNESVDKSIDDSANHTDFVEENFSTPIQENADNLVYYSNDLPETTRVMGITNVPLDRFRLKCSINCLWKGSAMKPQQLGACIQCTKGKCVKSYHVTCAIQNKIFLRLDDDNNLESYCASHNPICIEEKRLKAKKLLDAESLTKFSAGVQVIAKFSAVNYEGVVVEPVPHHGGCMVQYEGNENPHFTKWESLRVKDKEKVKVRKVPVYTDTIPRKKKKVDRSSSEISPLSKDVLPQTPAE